MSTLQNARRVLVLGGARSGKSRTAQQLAETSGLAPVYMATAQAGDKEMRERIAHHRAARDARWQTREEPLHLGEAIGAQSDPARVLLVDCLTLWLSNVMLADNDPDRASQALLAAIDNAAGPLILVSNEVGQGIVPDTPLGRAFRDAQGRLNQLVAARCDTVILVVAGCSVLIKPAPTLDVTLS